MILFHKLRYKNFLSTGNAFTELQLDKSSTTLIIGENGAGKSTILDALSFALFNKPFRKVSKTQLMNSITKKDLMVEIEFSVGQNKYKVVRGVKPNVFEVWMNGSMLNQSSDVRDYQEVLEKQILKINHKSFCQVVVLGSASFVPFMQLPAGQRREIIEDLLDLQIFTIMNSVLKMRVTENENNLWKTEKERDLIEEKIKLVKDHMIELKKSSDKLVTEKRDRIAESEKQKADLVEKCEALTREIDELKARTADHDTLSKRVNKLNGLKHQLEAKIAALKGDIGFLNDHENCPTCRQHIAEEFRAESIEKKNEDIASVDAGLTQLSEEYDRTSEKLSEIMDVVNQITDKNLERHRLITKIDGIDDYIKTLSDELTKIKKTSERPDTEKIDELNAQLEAARLMMAELDEEGQILAAAGVLLKDGGIKSRIIKQYIPIINKLINKYLAAFELFCMFELDENFNETIKSRFRDEFSYASFSEGEKQKIDLAILFTWRAIAKMRNSIHTNLLIMDEVFDSSLDSNAADYLLKIIQEISKDSNIFVISHRDQLNDKFDQNLKFIKHKNFSYIEAA